jgi:hypothetical protein
MLHGVAGVGGVGKEALAPARGGCGTVSDMAGNRS